jgi:hypothetical protein
MNELLTESLKINAYEIKQETKTHDGNCNFRRDRKVNTTRLFLVST